MTLRRWLALALLMLALVAGGALLLQRQEAAQLRDELTLLREGRRELAQLKAEQARLQAAQPTAAEWEQLRGDRAAVERMRTELNLLRGQIQAEAMKRPSE